MNIALGCTFVPYSGFNWLDIRFTGWLNRKKSFRLMSFSRISGALIIALISVGLGFYFKGPIGLLLGQLVSQLIVAAILAYNYFFKEKNILYFEFTSIRQVANKYINFPRYSFPADFIYQVINQLPVLMMTRYSVNLISVGLFNFSNRILGLPSMVVATAISEVFKQRAVQDYYEKGSCRTIFIKVLKSLVVTAILLISSAFDMGAKIFLNFAFGSKWRGAGEYSTNFSCYRYFFDS
ncbi:MAG: oligosaccharide flippase family protein [Chitinophagaceae bacterium]|nr:oligosaccharide flippase family protein [Chitinophagaceae bacterium]